jgi:hypothetical protein
VNRPGGRARAAKYTVAVVGCTFVCMGLLLSAGLKTWDLAVFHDTITRWRLVPSWLVPIVTVAVPLVEVAAATAWFAGKGQGFFRWTVPGVLVSFTAALALERFVGGSSAPCGCLGAAMQEKTVPFWQHATLNVLLCLPFMLRAKRTT